MVMKFLHTEGDANVLPSTGAVGRRVAVAPTDPVTSWESPAQSMYVGGSLLFCSAELSHAGCYAAWQSVKSLPPGGLTVCEQCLQSTVGCG